MDRIREGIDGVLGGLADRGDAAVDDLAGHGEAALGDATAQGDEAVTGLAGDAQAWAEEPLAQAGDAPQYLGGVVETVGDLVRKVTGS